MLDVTSPFFLDAPHLYGRPTLPPPRRTHLPLLHPPDRRAAQEGGRGSPSKVRVRGRDGAPDAAAVAGRGPPPSPAAKVAGAGAGAGAGGETALAGGQGGAAPGAANAAAADASAAATPAGAAAARIHPAKKKRAGGARSDAGCAPCRRGAAATQALCGSAPPPPSPEHRSCRRGAASAPLAPGKGAARWRSLSRPPRSRGTRRRDRGPASPHRRDRPRPSSLLRSEESEGEGGAEKEGDRRYGGRRGRI